MLFTPDRQTITASSLKLSKACRKSLLALTGQDRVEKGRMLENVRR